MPSTVIADIKYDEGTLTLRLEFRSGSIYDYYNVPRLVYENLKASASKGTFLNEYIKGIYGFQKVRYAKDSQ